MRKVLIVVNILLCVLSMVCLFTSHIVISAFLSVLAFVLLTGQLFYAYLKGQTLTGPKDHQNDSK